MLMCCVDYRLGNGLVAAGLIVAGSLMAGFVVRMMLPICAQIGTGFWLLLYHDGFTQ